MAATDENAAFDAAMAIKVTYEPLKAIFSPEEALANPEPQIHEYADEGNAHKTVALEFGDVEKGFAEADEIFDDTFSSRATPISRSNNTPPSRGGTPMASSPSGRAPRRRITSIGQRQRSLA